MRILTVRQPWAWAIVHGGKDVENRVRNIAGNYRGPVAIHAGLAQFEDEGQYREVKRAIVSAMNGWPADDSELWAADSIEPDDPRFVYGAIIGVVEIFDVHDVDDCVSTYGDLCSAWADGDTLSDLHLMLKNQRPLVTPIPYRGALGLRKLPADVIAQIEAEVAS